MQTFDAGNSASRMHELEVENNRLKGECSKLTDLLLQERLEAEKFRQSHHFFLKSIQGIKKMISFLTEFLRSQLSTLNLPAFSLSSMQDLQQLCNFTPEKFISNTFEVQFQSGLFSASDSPKSLFLLFIQSMISTNMVKSICSRGQRGLLVVTSLHFLVATCKAALFGDFCEQIL
jgi:hypothetical protein